MPLKRDLPPDASGRVQRQGVSGIIYGDSGLGKTSLVAALLMLMFKETGRRGIYCDWDGGDEDIPNWIEREVWLPGGGMAKTEAQESIDEALKMHAPVYVLDTMTLMGRRFLTDRPGKDGSDFQFSYADAQTDLMQWFLNVPRLTRTGCHVVLVAHSRVGEIKSAKGRVAETRGGPDCIGNQTIKNLPAMVNVCYRIANDAEHGRVLVPEGDEIYIAKDRLNAFLDSEAIKLSVPKKGTADEFERAYIGHYTKVWKAIFKAWERRRQVSNTPVQTEAVVTRVVTTTIST